MHTTPYFYMGLALVLCVTAQGQASARSPRFDAQKLITAKQNIRDLSGFATDDDLANLYDLCLASFDGALAADEIQLLLELADDVATIESNQDDYYWRTAVNIALYEQNRDIGRLTTRAKNPSITTSLPALTALCMLETSMRVGEVFLDRFRFAVRAERNGFDVHPLVLAVIADGLKQHDRGELVAKLTDHLNRHIIGPNMVQALMISFGAEPGSQFTQKDIIDLLEQQYQIPRSLSAVMPLR